MSICNILAVDYAGTKKELGQRICDYLMGFNSLDNAKDERRDTKEDAMEDDDDNDDNDDGVLNEEEANNEDEDDKQPSRTTNII